jgi:hypothetical protein
MVGLEAVRVREEEEEATSSLDDVAALEEQNQVPPTIYLLCDAPMGGRGEES